MNFRPRNPLLLIVALATMLLAPALASAHGLDRPTAAPGATAPLSENPQRGAQGLIPASRQADATLSPASHQGYTSAYGALVSESLLAPKSVSLQVRSAASKVEGFLGKDMVIKRADGKGFVALSKDGTRRFRLDLKGHGDAPHGHIEIFDAKRQRWIDGGPEHRYYFKGQE